MKVQPNPNITPHFKLREFDCKGTGEIVPAKYHANLTELCLLLEDIRTLFGDRPLTITSGYRSKAHNDLIYKKARRHKPTAGTLSQHLTASAADFHIQGCDIGDVEDVLVFIYNNDFENALKFHSTFFNGLEEDDKELELFKSIRKRLRGIGRGSYQGFVHVDVRKGKRAKWTY